MAELQASLGALSASASENLRVDFAWRATSTSGQDGAPQRAERDRRLGP